VAATDGATALQPIDEACQIGIKIGVQRIAHTGLRREMHHIGKFIRLKQPSRSRSVSDVEFFEPKRRKAAQLTETSTLERGVIVVVEIVDPDDRAALLEKAANDMEPNESGGARHEYWRPVLHARLSPWYHQDASRTSGFLI